MKALKFLRSEDWRRRVLDELSGKEVYIGRTNCKRVIMEFLLADAFNPDSPSPELMGLTSIMPSRQRRCALASY